MIESPSVRRDLPSGLVTFVFADIEGSTRLFRRSPDGYPAVLDRHREILREVWPAWGGVEVETEGDGTLIAFADASRALVACARAQQRLTAEPWPDGLEVRVRMGVHTGLAQPVTSDYVALAVHQAARVAATAHGGQVVVSKSTIALLGERPDVGLSALGRFRIRDFDDPVALYQLDDEGLPSEFPPVRAMPAEGHNLTRPLTSFVGRDADRQALLRALGPRRLVTVVGPGGVGKSRLAVEVGLELAPAWADGVWRVPVDDLADSAAFASALANTLSVRLVGGDTEGQLIAALWDHESLLLLDGCERHLDAVARLVDGVRARCPRVGVLVTSREPLHLPGEFVLRLEPLRVGQPSGSAAEASPAVRLFLDRAQAAGSTLDLTSANAGEIYGVTRRLDGLPLAIEVAAAFLSAFSLTQLLTGLDEGLGAMHSRDRSLPARQRSLDSLLDWSDQLLSETERLAFHRLSVLAASFSLATAKAVAGGAPVESEDVPEALWSLADRSLVHADPSSGGTRYRLLQLVRRYAARKLEESGDAGAVVLRAGAWYRSQVGPASAGDRTWFGAMTAELDNLRALIPRLATLSDQSARTSATELAVSVARFHDGFGSYEAGIEECRRWAELLPESPSRVALITAVADLFLRMNEPEKAAALADQAAEMRARVGAPAWDEVGVERTLGEIAERSGRPAEAALLAREALTRDLSTRSRARMFNMLGIAEVHAGHAESARVAFASELAAAQELGDDLLSTRAHANVAELAFRLGHRQEAARHQLACLELANVLGQPVFVAYALIVAAELAAATSPGDAAAAMTAGMSILEGARHRLYAGDQVRANRLLDDARAVLHEDAFLESERMGRTWDLEAASRQAEAILTSVVAEARLE